MNPRRQRILGRVYASIGLVIGISLLFSAGIFSLSWWIGGFIALWGALYLVFSWSKPGKGELWVKEWRHFSFDLGKPGPDDDEP